MKTATFLRAAAVAALAVAATAPAAAYQPAFPNAARSVHLWYKSPFAPEKRITEVQSSVTIRETQYGTFFMCLGFQCGYCGFQEHYDGRKIFIFSVWDPGNPYDFKANPESVGEDRRTKVLYSDPAVRVIRFGGEGTGGQATMPYNWKIGYKETVRITAEPDGPDRTAFTAWLATPGAPGGWRKMATFSTLAAGKNPLFHANAFIEDFRRDGLSVKQTRRAEFTGVSFKAGGVKKPCTAGTFGADSGKPINIDAMPSPDGWTLATGGDVKNETTKLGGTMPRGKAAK